VKLPCANARIAYLNRSGLGGFSNARSCYWCRAFGFEYSMVP
jgi:hypothetical protein